LLSSPARLLMVILFIVLALLVTPLTSAPGLVATRSISSVNQPISAGGATQTVIFQACNFPSSLTGLQVSFTLFLPGSFSSPSYSYASQSFANLFIGLQLSICCSPTTIFPLINLVALNQFGITTTPGIVVLNFDDNALLPITTIRNPYTGSFNVGPNVLSNYIKQATGDISDTLTFIGSVQDTTSANGHLLSFAVTVNCPATKAYALYLPISPNPRQPPTTVDTNGKYFSAVSGNQLLLENVIRRGSGINARLSGITVDFNIVRYKGVNHNCGSTGSDNPTSTPADYSDTSVVLQFFPDVGPMANIVLDSATGAQWQQASSWVSPNSIAGLTAGRSITYWVSIGDLNWSLPVSISNEYYRQAAQTVKLVGASPYGTWRVIINDAVVNNVYWCVSNININLQTCDPTSTNPCC